MISTFRQVVKQTKMDALRADMLLEDTERFFKNNRKLKTMINKPKTSLKQSNRKRETHIY